MTYILVAAGSGKLVDGGLRTRKGWALGGRVTLKVAAISENNNENDIDLRGHVRSTTGNKYKK